MIEVCNVNFLSDREEKDLFLKKMTPIVRILSDTDGQKMYIKIVYIATSLTDAYDQVLCDEEIEEIPKGVVEFDLECSSPDLSKIPQKYLLGLTSIVVICYTKEKDEFVRIGYFVKVEYPGIWVKEEDIEGIEGEEEEDDSSEKEEEEVNDLIDDERDEIGENNLKQESISSEQRDTPLYLEDPLLQDSLSEEENDLEMEIEKIPEGYTVVTPDEFSQMEIDLSKIEAKILEPPLVTVFSEAWEKERSAWEEEENEKDEEKEELYNGVPH